MAAHWMSPWTRSRPITNPSILEISRLKRPAYSTACWGSYKRAGEITRLADCDLCSFMT